jgi:hypothetical protein
MAVVLLGCAGEVRDDALDAASEPVEEEPTSPTQPTGAMFTCGNFVCYIDAQYCLVVDDPGTPPPPPTFMCVPFDAGPTCGSYPIANSAGGCGCTISDAGAFTITECLK